MLVRGAKKKFWIPQSPALWHKATGGGGGPLVPAKVQGSLHSNGGTSSTTVAVTLPAPVTAGNLVCIALGAVVSTSTMKDNLGANATASVTTSLGGFFWSAFYFPNVSGAPQTYTATISTASAFSTIIATEFSGVLTSSPLDGAAINGNQVGNSDPDGITSTATTTTANGNLVWGACVNIDGLATVAKGTGFTQDQISGQDFNTEYLVQTTAGSVAATWNGDAGTHFSSLMMAFKHA